MMVRVISGVLFCVGGCLWVGTSSAVVGGEGGCVSGTGDFS